MATWEDGPEYAPRERPAEFSAPSVTPLQDAPAVADLSAGAPLAQPRFDAPQVPVAPLATLVPAEVGPERDPQQPFDVVAATMTPEPAASFGTAPVHATGGAWGAAHWSPPNQNVASTPGPWGPPTGTPWPAPTAPFPAASYPGPTPGPGGFPAPGSPQWFGPGPAQPTPSGSGPDAKAVAAAVTPGVLITLALGLVWALAPFTFCVAFFLTARIKVARVQVQRVYLGALGVLGLVAIVAALTNLGTFGDWWSVLARWALVLSVLMLVVIPVLVRRELIDRERRRHRWP